MVRRYRVARRQKRLRLIYGVVTLLVIILAALELTNTTHLFHNGTPATKQIVSAGNQTQQAQDNTSASSTPVSKTPSNSSTNQGGAIDTSGQQSANTDPSTWTTSKSGNITVKQPTANSKFDSGSVLSGSAKVSQVQYRLIDSQVGVIAQGQLAVVNGNFSGTLKFQTHGNSGRLDVFSLDSDGTEINEVQIAITF